MLKTTLQNIPVLQLQASILHCTFALQYPHNWNKQIDHLYLKKSVYPQSRGQGVHEPPDAKNNGHEIAFCISS